MEVAPTLGSVSSEIAHGLRRFGADGSSIVASVIIPAHNASATIGHQLSALAAQVDAPPFEVLVVANRCTDDTVMVSRGFQEQLPGLSTRTADQKASAAYARNVGAREARGRFLLFCDADDEVGPTWVQGMVDALRTVSIAGGTIDPQLERVPAWMLRLPGLLTRPQDGLVLFDGRIWYPPTCCFGCRRDEFHAVGGFDESFTGANSEDLELTSRLLVNGGRVGLAPTARVRYTPRATYRSYVQQQAGYRAGDARLLADAGRLSPPRRLRAELKALTFRLARDALKGRIVDPRVHLAIVRLQLSAYRSQRRAFAVQGEPIRRHDPVDTVLPPDTPVVGGMAVRTRLGIANWLATRETEPLSLRALALILPSGGTLVDVGANIGVLTLAGAALVGDTGRVVSFEPDPRSRDLLVTNIARHGFGGRVTVMAEAVGNDHIDSDFVLAAAYELSGLRQEGSPPTDPTIRVEQVPLDEVVSGRVDVLKIDVEGSELGVLQGARELLEVNPDLSILCEINPDALRVAGVAIEDVIELLEDHGRRSLMVLEDQHTSPWSGQIRDIEDVGPWLDSGGGRGWYANVLATPRHQFAHIKACLGGTSSGLPTLVPEITRCPG